MESWRKETVAERWSAWRGEVTGDFKVQIIYDGERQRVSQ